MTGCLSAPELHTLLLLLYQHRIFRFGNCTVEIFQMAKNICRNSLGKQDILLEQNFNFPHPNCFCILDLFYK